MRRKSNERGSERQAMVQNPLVAFEGCLEGRRTACRSPRKREQTLEVGTGQPGQHRQFFGAVQAYPFLPVEFATDQADLTFGDAKRLGQKSHQMGVGLAFDRWGGEPDFQAVTVQASELIAAGLGLLMTIENQDVTVPAEITHQIRPNSSSGIPTDMASGGIT